MMSKLHFVGTGSAFNTEFGNNNAYIKKDNQLFLIDCGSSTFSRLKSTSILDDVESITVLITHLHPDHVGSVGDLIFYSHYSMPTMFGRKLEILIPTPISLKLKKVLNSLGVNSDLYTMIDLEIGELYESENATCPRILPIEVNHVQNMDCFGYILNNRVTTIYYSGDSNMISKAILDGFLEKNDMFVTIDYIYQDTCLADYEGNVHLSLRKLAELIPPEYRHKVFCMHIDDFNLIDKARNLGFNCVYPQGWQVN